MIGLRAVKRVEEGRGRGGEVAGSQNMEGNPAPGQKFNMEGATLVHVSSNVNTE